MKKILITISGGFIARNIARSGVLDRIVSSGAQVILAVPQEKQEYYAQEFGSEKIEVMPSPHVNATIGERIFSFVGRNALRTESVRMIQKSEYELHGRFILYCIKRVLYYAFGRSSLFQKIFRFLDASLSQSGFNEMLRHVRPDLIFATNVVEGMDIAFLREARRMSIKTIGMVKSWDNLTNHGMLREFPDTLIVHNPYIKRCAEYFHHVPEKIIVMTGIPQYDWYVRKDIFTPREEFLKKIGVDPLHKVILFAGIGDYLAPREGEVVKIMSEMIEKGEVPYPVTIVFRPHPNFMVVREKIAKLPHVVFDDASARYTSEKKSSWEMGKEEMTHLVNSLRHADLVVNVASTMTIDAVAFGKPVICIGFDGESEEPYHNSVLRFYRDFTHYKMITRTHGFKLAYTRDELLSYTLKYLKNPEIDSEGRKKIFEDFIWKLDGRSGERLAKVITDRL